MSHRAVLVLSLAFIMMMGNTNLAFSQGGLVRKPIQEISEAIGKWLGKTSGRELTEEIAGLGGEAALRELAERTLLEGGDDALSSLIRLTKAHGPDVLRATKNSPNIPTVLKALDNLPEGIVKQASRRLAAGEEGRLLARLVDELGESVLIAEVRHPGIGGRLVGDLGDDGFQLATKLSTEDAVALAKHSGDIASLPTSQQKELLKLLQNKPAESVGFMNRFVDKNPGKILFTAAVTTFVLTNPERILGGGEIVIGPDGKPQFVPKPGLLERLVGSIVGRVFQVLLPIIVVVASIWLIIKAWFWYRLCKLKHTVAISKIISANDEDESSA